MQAVAALNSTLFSLVDRLPIILVFSLPILSSLYVNGDQQYGSGGTKTRRRHLAFLDLRTGVSATDTK